MQRSRSKLWKEYTAPNGLKYYYNTKTQETTWTKPDTEQKDETTDKEIKVKPLVAFELLAGWALIIFSDGSKKYYNCNESQWSRKISHLECLKLIDLLNKDRLLLLIGIIRGYRCRTNAKDLVNEIREDIDSIREDMNAAKTSEDMKSGSTVSNIENTKNALLGYYSSDDEEEPAKRDEQTVVEEPDETNTLEVPDITQELGQDIKDSYFALFAKHELNKYSTWRIESEKVSQDPEFYKIMDDAVRENIFEEWCNAGSVESNEESGDPGDDQFEPTKYHYLSQLVANYDLKPDTIPEDIIKDKKLIKKYRIKDYTTKSEQRQFLSKMLAWYKHMSLEDRKQMFQTYIDRIPVGKYTDIDSDAQEDVESQLLELENQLGIPTSENDLEYYCIDLRSKRDILLSTIRNRVNGK